MYATFIQDSMIRSIILCVALLGAAATTSRAQDVEALLQSAAKQNWYIRAAAESNARWEGRVTFDDHKILVGGSAVSFDNIRTIERRTNVGGGWKAGAIIGAGSGAALGFMLAGLCEFDCGGQGLIGALVFGGIGALLGGVTGQLVKPPEHQWNPVWP